MRRIYKPQRNVRDLSQSARRTFRASLAEDYDGIGQYTLVALSRSSGSSALRARVAAGHFGTGQIIPVGTPVTVFVNHGSIEILSLGAK